MASTTLSPALLRGGEGFSYKVPTSTASSSQALPSSSSAAPRHTSQSQSWHWHHLMGWCGVGLFNGGQVVFLFLLKPPSPMPSKVNDDKILSKMFVPGTKQENIITAGKHPFARSVVGSYQKLFPRCPDLQLWERFGKTSLPSSEDQWQGAQRRSGPPLLPSTPLYSPG